MDRLVADRSVCSRCENDTYRKKGLEKLLKRMNNPLSSHGILVDHGAVLNGYLTLRARRPKVKKTIICIKMAR